MRTMFHCIVRRSATVSVSTVSETALKFSGEEMGAEIIM